MKTNPAYSWYKKLKKPSWAPPSWLFGPVWTFLYSIIAVSFGTAFYKTYFGGLPVIVALPFALNLVFNAAFSPIQFRLRSNFFAAIDILLTLATLIWACAAVFPYVAWISIVNIPYLLWVCFATVLQLTITKLNWKT
jgi:tryptophan-rich sensory protein